MVETIRPVTYRRTILAAALAAGMAAYIYWIEQPRFEEEQAAGHLIVFEPERVDQVVLRYPDSPPMVVQRNGQKWRLLEPADKPADENTIRLLLNAIRQTPIERHIDGEKLEDLSTYGLDGDGERARISLRLDDGQKLPDIIVGRTTPVGYQTFVRVVGRDELLVTPLLFHSGVKKTAFDLRSKTIFEVSPETVQSATLTTPDGEFALDRRDGGWHIAAPVNARADSDTITTMLSSLNAITALAFYEDAEDDLERFGLARAAVQFKVVLNDGRREGLAIGAASGDTPAGFYAQRTSDGQLFKGPDWMMSRYAMDLTALRDKHLFTCQFDHVGKVSIERTDSGTFALARDEKGVWHSPTHPAASLNQRRVDRAVRGLVDLAGESLLEQAVFATYGLETPDVTASITDIGGDSCGDAIAVRAPGGAGYYIAQRSSNTVMEIAEHLYSRVDIRLEDLLEESP
jgi:hypothetical protein